MKNTTLQPTVTGLVLEHLVRTDDMQTAKQIALALHKRSSDVRRALWHLHAHHAVNFDLDLQREEHWFATPEEDNRFRVVKELPPGRTRPNSHGHPSSLPKARAVRQKRLRCKKEIPT